MAGDKETTVMDLTPLMPWLAAAVSISHAIAGVYSWATSPARRNAEEIGKIKSDQAAHDRRIQAVEAEIKHMPDSGTIHKLELFMEKLSGRLDSIDGRFDTVDEKLKPIQAATERMNEVLMSGARK
ncbi:Conserved hypothetical protein [Brucella intermedia LMG 3301]|uniref:Uncharacterized protein n=2 Tax=Brucella/Ochrobactrum group TaxID=2826938 RepID=C4WG43_9HYPH|nr:MULTISPECIES: DUF2730 family protein [Brucella]EEQ96350.1 Conserved hypothetical protein [Brucella intermedia LMG 3301]UGQ20410.1 DUF2730 domain-containing protein [Brucella anthropi]SUB13336.1 Protein of uncharacterised function (DUF2730) [Brucella intermedia]